MNSPIHELTINNSLTTKLILAATLLLATSTSFAEDADLTYVDSVHNWGAWGLDLEPAAGGLTPPTTQALNARNTKVVLRTNSIAALAPPASPIQPEIPVAPPTPPIAPPPVPPIAPSIPTAPTTFAPPGATPIVPVTLPPRAPSIIPAAPSTFAPPGATPTITVTLP